MAQKKIIKDRGEFWFVKTWVNASGAHVGLLVGGGYLHFSGLPIAHKNELTEVIPPGPDRRAAEEWWENRGKIEEAQQKKRIIAMGLDGVLRFQDDGTDVKTPSDIINNTLPGPVQDAFLKVLHQKQEAEDRTKLREASRIQQQTKKTKAEALAGSSVE